MKVIELLKISKIMLETLQDSCIKVNDVRFVEMYDEYIKLVEEGCKKSYISAMLSDKFKISERQFFYIIKKLNQDCKKRAVSLA